MSNLQSCSVRNNNVLVERVEDDSSTTRTTGLILNSQHEYVRVKIVRVGSKIEDYIETGTYGYVNKQKLNKETSLILDKQQYYLLHEEAIVIIEKMIDEGE